MVTTWSNEDTLKLIELLGDEEIQVLMEGCTRNKHVFEKIAARMTEAGYSNYFKEIAQGTHNLTVVPSTLVADFNGCVAQGMLTKAASSSPSSWTVFAYSITNGLACAVFSCARSEEK